MIHFFIVSYLLLVIFLLLATGWHLLCLLLIISCYLFCLLLIIDG